MRRFSVMALVFSFVAMLLMLAAPAIAQDAVKADADHHKVVFENDQVRVVKYFIAPGDKTAQHEHPKNVQVMLTDHNGKVTTPDGKTSEAHGKAGTAVWRNAGTHIVENIGDKPIEGILVEPKNTGTSEKLTEAMDPSVLDAAHTKVEFENDQVRVLRYHYAPKEVSPMHEHPDNVQIMLTDTKNRVTSADGKKTESGGKMGDANWRPATKHSVENIGDQPFEGILVEFKGGSKTASASK